MYIYIIYRQITILNYILIHFTTIEPALKALLNILKGSYLNFTKYIYNRFGILLIYI